jgi:hypothetical protein
MFEGFCLRKFIFNELKTTLDADVALKSSVKTFFTKIHLSELEITLYQDGSFQSGFKMTSSIEIHSFEVTIISPRDHWSDHSSYQNLRDMYNGGKKFRDI